MSRYTDVVLLAGHAPPELLAPYLEAIATWTHEGSTYPLQALDARRYAVAAESLNRLPIEAFLAMLRSLPWDALGATVQLAVQDQDDYGHTLHPIHPLPRAAADPVRARAIADVAACLPAPWDGMWFPERVPPDFVALDAAAIAYLASRGFTVTGGPAGPRAPRPGTT